MFYGWGRKSKDWMTADGRAVVLQYKYVSLMFIFKLAYGLKWYVMDNNRANDREISQQEAAQLLPGQNPGLNPFERFGLLIALAVILVIGLLAAMFGK